MSQEVRPSMCEECGERKPRARVSVEKGERKYMVWLCKAYVREKNEFFAKNNTLRGSKCYDAAEMRMKLEKMALEEQKGTFPSVIEEDGALVDARGELSAAEMQLAESLFEAVDLDGSGEISWTEVVAVFQRMGEPEPSELEARLIISELDDDGNGEISLTEFVQGLRQMKEGKKLAIERILRLQADRDPLQQTLFELMLDSA